MEFKESIKGDKVSIRTGTWNGYRGTVTSVKDGFARVRLAGGQDCIARSIITVPEWGIATYHRPRVQ